MALELGFILGQNAKCLSSVLEKSNVVLFFLCLVVKETIFFPLPMQMILKRYMNSDWLRISFSSWVQRCQNAYSAESVEMLKEVCIFFPNIWNRCCNKLSPTPTNRMD